MKILNKMSFIVASVAILTTVSSCKKILVEKPQQNLYPDYFSTAGGVVSGITGVYQDLRQYYSGEPVFWWDGTDDATIGSSGGGALPLDTYSGINSSNTGPGFGNLWSDINTLNGVIQFAPAINVDAATKAAYIAQAQFLRAYIYLYLVQSWGGTTATQPSGIPLHTTFLTAATSADAPAPASAIYNQIIADLTAAAATLPNTITASNPFSAAGVGKTATVAVANAYLAKTYLTRGYLSEIAQPGDFQKAADLTAAIIAAKATYGLDLWQDYNDAMNQVNDYGKENMFAIDYGITDPAYSGYTLQGSGGYGLNELPQMFRCNYIASPKIDNIPGKVDAVPQVFSGPSPMQRDVYNGRPYIRVAPNAVYTNKVFDQVHDTRYDATFQTFWICNTVGATAAGKKSDGTLKPKLASVSNFSSNVYNIPFDGDTAVLISPVNVTMARRDAFPGVIITPSQISNDMYPTVKKFDDTRRTFQNDFSGRPEVMLRFSEMYLINAEANYMLGNAGLAAASLNVLRTRAAFRTPADGAHIPKSQFSVTAANQAAMNAANVLANQLTPAQVALLSVPNNTTDFVNKDICGMDVILDEYTREFFGDPRRWYDLVRTQQLVRRVKLYNAKGAPNVQTYHMRRPIPQSEIDNVLTGPKYPQNTGY